MSGGCGLRFLLFGKAFREWDAMTKRMGRGVESKV